MKKFFKSFFICLIIIAMVSTTAFAAAPNDSVDLQANRYVLKTTVGIVALGSGRIEVDFSVTAAGKMPDVGAMYVDIYNASGKCVKTYWYTDSGYGHMMGHNLRMSPFKISRGQVFDFFVKKILAGIRRCGKSTILEMLELELLKRGISEGSIIQK